MYGLKPDVDLSFFIGRELTQLSVAPYNVQFHFDGPMPSSLSDVQSLVSLTVQSLVEHSSKGIVKEWDGDENVPLSAASLLGLVGLSVVSVQGDPDGTLTLEFSNGDFVRVFDTEGYEAYQICNEGVSIYV
jgi:hypothetical protein